MLQQRLGKGAVLPPHPVVGNRALLGGIHQQRVALRLDAGEPTPDLSSSASVHPEMLDDDGAVHLDLAGRPCERHAAGVEDDDVVGEV